MDIRFYPVGRYLPSCNHNEVHFINLSLGDILLIEFTAISSTASIVQFVREHDLVDNNALHMYHVSTPIPTNVTVFQQDKLRLGIFVH